MFKHAKLLQTIDGQYFVTVLLFGFDWIY